MNRPWTRAEECRLEQLLVDGRSGAAAASALGRTVSAVRCKAHELRLYQSRPRALEWADVFRLGLSLELSARCMGRGRSTASSWKTILRRRGLLGRLQQ